MYVLITYKMNFLISTSTVVSRVAQTDYGLEGPGSNPGGDEIFRPSRPALGPTQPPVQWISFPGVEVAGAWGWPPPCI